MEKLWWAVLYGKEVEPSWKPHGPLTPLGQQIPDENEVHRMSQSVKVMLSRGSYKDCSKDPFHRVDVMVLFSFFLLWSGFSYTNWANTVTTVTQKLLLKNPKNRKWERMQIFLWKSSNFWNNRCVTLLWMKRDRNVQTEEKEKGFVFANVATFSWWHLLLITPLYKLALWCIIYIEGGGRRVVKISFKCIHLFI